MRSDLELTEKGPSDELLMSPPMPIYDAMMSYDFAYKPSYVTVSAPALAIFAFNPHAPLSRSETDAPATTRAGWDAWWRRANWDWQRGQVEKFRREAPHGHAITLSPAEHLVYFSNTAQVVTAINGFLARL